MNNPMLQSFLSTALPVMAAILFGVWTNNKRLDDLARCLDRIEAILDRIQEKLSEHGEHIARLELRH
jgi:hypothetical protein